MPSNIMIFDADYISELTSAMNEACELVGEAVASLKKASLHEGWKCKECTRISENLDDLNLRLGRLDQGVNETVRVLGGSVSRFAELEAKYETQANSLSDDLRTNYGYSGSMHESSTGSAAQSVGTGAAGAAAAAGSKAEIPNGKPASHSNGAVPHVNVAGIKMPGFGGNTNINNNFNSVNLPVTHIPDRPDDVATGTKDAEEISLIAVESVADTITQVLGKNLSVKIVAPDGSDRTVEHLIETFNAGKSIVENSARIVSDTSMPHTEERIAVAAGIASLAGSAVTGLGMLKSAGETVKTAASIQDLGKQAENLLPSIKDNDELKSVLGAISLAGEASVSSSSSSSSSSKSNSSIWSGILEGREVVNNFVEKFVGIGGSSGSASSVSGSFSGSSGNSVSLAGLASNSSTGAASSGNSGQNFLNQLMDSLLTKFTGNSTTASSSSSSSSPVQKFLSSFVADLV